MSELCFPVAAPKPQPPVALPDPYPRVRITQADPACACSLLTALAGRDGEMTTIYEYLYQHWMLTSVYEELAYTLIRMVHVEIVHLQLLGGLIVQLGGNPRCMYPTRKGFRPWTGSMVDYARSVREVLEFDIRHEQATLEAYEHHANIVQDSCASTLLLRLAQDERLHKRILETYLSRLEHD